MLMDICIGCVNNNFETSALFMLLTLTTSGVIQYIEMYLIYVHILISSFHVK